MAKNPYLEGIPDPEEAVSAPPSDVVTSIGFTPAAPPAPGANPYLAGVPDPEASPPSAPVAAASAAPVQLSSTAPAEATPEELHPVPDWIDNLRESIVPTKRSGRDEALHAYPDLLDAPEMRNLIGARALGGTLAPTVNADVVRAIIQTRIPDAKVELAGPNKNYVKYTSPEDGKVYTWKPGFQPSDVTRGLLGIGLTVPLMLLAAGLSRGRSPLLAGAVGAGAGAAALEGLKSSAGPDLPPRGGEFQVSQIPIAAGIHMAPSALSKMLGTLQDKVLGAEAARLNAGALDRLGQAGAGDAVAGQAFAEGLGRDPEAVAAIKALGPEVEQNVTPDMLAGTEESNLAHLRASQATKSAASKAGGTALNQEDAHLAAIAQAGRELAPSSTAAADAQVKTSLEQAINDRRAIEKTGYDAIRKDIGRQRFDAPAVKALLRNTPPDALPPAWKNAAKQLFGAGEKPAQEAREAAASAVAARTAARDAAERAKTAIAEHADAVRTAEMALNPRTLVKAAEKARERAESAVATMEQTAAAAAKARQAAETAVARAKEMAKPSFENISMTKKLVSQSARPGSDFTNMTDGQKLSLAGALAADERGAALAGGHPEIDALHKTTQERMVAQDSAKQLGLTPVKDAATGTIALTGDSLVRVQQSVKQLTGGRIEEFAKNVAAIPAADRPLAIKSALPALMGEKADQPLNFIKFHENFTAIEKNPRAMAALASGLGDPELVQKLKAMNVLSGKIARMVRMRSGTGQTATTTAALGSVNSLLDTMARHGAWIGGAVGGVAGFAQGGTHEAAAGVAGGHYAGGKIGNMLSAYIRGDNSAATRAADAFLASPAFQMLDFTGKTAIRPGKFAQLVSSRPYNAMMDAFKIPANVASRKMWAIHALTRAGLLSGESASRGDETK